MSRAWISVGRDTLVAMRLSVALALLLFVPATTSAQPRDEVAAEALFVEARRLMDAKKFDEAADRLIASDRAAPSVGARLSLGDCYRALNKTASAWGAYRSAANLARRGQDDRRAVAAEKRAAELEPDLSYLAIEVPKNSQIPGLEITWNQMPRARPLWGVRFPVDPGIHAVGASAPGFAPWKIELVSEAGGEHRIKIPRLETAKAGTETTPLTSPVLDESPRDRGEPSPFTTGRKIALGLGVVGVVGVSAGTIFGLSAHSKWSDAENDHCTDISGTLECDSTGLELAADAGAAADRATIAFVAGGAAVAAAAVLWFVAAPDDAPTATAAIGPNHVGVTVAGRF
jgi:hypothetical protein